MIITISGTPGSGKSTVAAIVAKRFGLNHYSSGDLMRKMARKRKVSIIALTKVANKDDSVDDEIDEWVSKLAKYEDNFVIDSRLAFYFIPGSIKIFLDVDVKEGARRILLQRRTDEPENSDLRATMNNIEKRKESEKIRYRRLYKINPFNKKNYDAYLDTTGMNALQVAGTVIRFIESMMKPKKKVEAETRMTKPKFPKLVEVAVKMKKKKRTRKKKKAKKKVRKKLKKKIKKKVKKKTLKKKRIQKKNDAKKKAKNTSKKRR